MKMTKRLERKLQALADKMGIETNFDCDLGWFDFNDNPNTEVYMNLFKKLADEFIVEEKRRIMRVKMRKLNDDF